MTLKEIFEYNFINTDHFTISLLDLVLILVVILATWTATLFIRRYFYRKARAGKTEQGTATSITQLFKYVCWFIAIIICLHIADVNVGIIIASSAAVMVGVGFGLQQLFKDLISGVFILFEGNIHVGDLMEVQNGVVGRVIHIGIRTSEIITGENHTVIVPNSQFLSDAVINWTNNKEQLTRSSITIGVGYESNIRLVEKILLEVATAHPSINQYNKPFVRFQDFGDSALIFELFFFTDDSTIRDNVKSDLRFQIFDRFNEQGISIPFPQRDVRIIKG